MIRRLLHAGLFRRATVIFPPSVLRGRAREGVQSRLFTKVRERRSILVLMGLVSLLTLAQARAQSTPTWIVSPIPPLASFPLHGPYGISRGPDGALYICDCDAQLLLK